MSPLCLLSTVYCLFILNGLLCVTLSVFEYEKYTTAQYGIYICRMKNKCQMLQLDTGLPQREQYVMTKVQVPPYATLVFVSLFITPFTLHVSALLICHLQV
jgi:hypothetical protein